MCLAPQEAIRITNDTTYGLASGIQTSNLGRALRIADKIKAGTVWLNTWHKYHPNAPFGGYKLSGYGREQGAKALENYAELRFAGILLDSTYIARTTSLFRLPANPFFTQTLTVAALFGCDGPLSGCL